MSPKGATMPTPPTQLRRSPRKAAIKIEADELTAPSRITKKGSPAKKKAAPSGKTTAQTTKGAEPTSRNRKAAVAPSLRVRGRPKKVTPVEPAKATEHVAPTSSPRKTTTTQTVVSALPAQDEWTDSPAKKSSAKRISKTPDHTVSFTGDVYSANGKDIDKNIRLRQVSVGGVRKSIEVLNATRGGSKKESKNPGISSKGQRARSTSLQSPIRSTRSPSKSMPAANIVLPKALSPGGKFRSPSRSRVPSVIRESSRNTSKCPSVAPGGTLKVNKHRKSRSPARQNMQSRQKNAATASIQSDSLQRPNGQLQSPARARSKSRAKTSRPQRPSLSREAAFLERFLKDDGYGRVLRNIESEGYKMVKHGEGAGARRDSNLDADDEQRAWERGVNRAELELNLNGIAESMGRRAGSGDDNVTLQLPASKGGDQSPRRNFSRGQSAGPQAVTLPDVELLPADEPSAPGRGKVRSITNPEKIPGMSKKNPFFETLPAPEVWHRRMAPYFPFGETPFMAQAMSRQISEDLARGKEEAEAKANKAAGLLSRATSTVTSGVKSTMNAVGQSVFGTPASSRDPQYPPMWALPEVSTSEVLKVMKHLPSIKNTSESRSATRKRKGIDSGPERPVRRARRRSSGEYRMSGAL